MAGCHGWKIRVVKAVAGGLPEGRHVLAVLDEEAREAIYHVDTSVPEPVWMAAFSACLTDFVKEWAYIGDVLRLPELSA
jgi:hypothetical protein